MLEFVSTGNVSLTTNVKVVDMLKERGILIFLCGRPVSPYVHAENPAQHAHP